MAVTINGTTGVTTNNSVYTDASGNTGIGTTSPAHKLDVNGNANLVSTAYLSWNGSSSYSIQGVGGGSGYVRVITGGSEAMRIDSNGIVTGTAGNLMLVSGTSVSASGTSVEFTGIPSWVKRITLQLAGISTNGTAAYLVQIGSGSFTTSGYSSQSWASTGGGVVTSGFSIITAAQAALIYTGQIVLTKYTSNTWLSSGIVAITSTTSNAYQSSGYSSDLGAALDRVRITTVGGTNTFDAGTINILYE